MVFSSLVFLLVFLPCVLVCYFLVRGIRPKNAVLCLFSLVFYAWGEPVYLFLMIGLILINYGLALAIGRAKNKPARSLLLTAALIADLGAIGFFKYGDFVLRNLEALLGVPMPALQVSLPIGISFFTFQIISYMADVYRRETPPQRSLLKLATYICLFPQLVAGPIVRYQTVAEELDHREESFSLFTQGLHRFVIGLGKKVVFANAMAMLADTVFDQAALPSGGALWLGAIAYMLQIYYDFSGYSDMAIGMGRMFGFHFLENFNYPYIASSVTDFWRRWHISLSSCFRDYVYIPLGGSRRGMARTALNMLAVWALTGLWHGASWNFILWGLYYFVFLLVEKLLGRERLMKVPAVLRHVCLLLIVLGGWIIFRLESLEQIGAAFAGLFRFEGTTAGFLLSHHDALYPLFLLIPACAGCLPLAGWLRKKLPPRLSEIGCTAGDILLFALCVALLLGATYNPFIYFRF